LWILLLLSALLLPLGLLLSAELMPSSGTSSRRSIARSLTWTISGLSDGLPLAA
jgi:hypothetical protein